MASRHRKLSRFQNRYPEQLESRHMLSGGALGAAMMPMAHSAGNQSVFVGSAVPCAKQQPSTSQGTLLSAKLTDSASSATGMAMYATRTLDGVTTRKFMVEVRGAAVNTTLDVSIDGTVVGQLTTDSNGDGRLILSSNPKNSDEQELPANFPTAVTAGTSISVGTLSGSLATPSKQKPPETMPVPGTILSAKLTDAASSATGMAMYGTHTIDGVTTTKFMVEVRNAAANTTLDVTIGDTVVGHLTTDSNGDGRLILSSNPKNSNEQALPSNFPTTIAANTTITVGTLTGSLTTALPTHGHDRSPPTTSTGYKNTTTTTNTTTTSESEIATLLNAQTSSVHNIQATSAWIPSLGRR